jgi:hypothetical protein
MVVGILIVIVMVRPVYKGMEERIKEPFASLVVLLPISKILAMSVARFP